MIFANMREKHHFQIKPMTRHQFFKKSNVGCVAPLDIFNVQKSGYSTDCRAILRLIKAIWVCSERFFGQTS